MKLAEWPAFRSQHYSKNRTAWVAAAGAAGIDGGSIAGSLGKLAWRTHPPHMPESQCCRDRIASSVSPGECFFYSAARQPNKAREVPIVPLHLNPAGQALKPTQTWLLVWASNEYFLCFLLKSELLSKNVLAPWRSLVYYLAEEGCVEGRCVWMVNSFKGNFFFFRR